MKIDKNEDKNRATLSGVKCGVGGWCVSDQDKKKVKKKYGGGGG